MKDLTYLPNYADMGGWKARHQAAVFGKTNQATPVVTAIASWISYAEKHEKRFESKIGDDGVLGPAWAQWGDALRQLLNGDLGQADCGTLDTILVDNLMEQGFNPDDL